MQPSASLPSKHLHATSFSPKWVSALTYLACFKLNDASCSCDSGWVLLTGFAPQVVIPSCAPVLSAP